jgi:hypothetical protein
LSALLIVGRAFIRGGLRGAARQLNATGNPKSQAAAPTRAGHPIMFFIFIIRGGIRAGQSQDPYPMQ